MQILGGNAPLPSMGFSMDDAVRIEVIKGGYGVYVCDPAISESNQDPKKPWKDPMVEYHFEYIEQVLTFIKEILPKFKPKDQTNEFDAAFKRAVAEDVAKDKMTD